jgi:hypothetical protein
VAQNAGIFSSNLKIFDSVSTYILKLFVVSICCLTMKEKIYHQKFGKKSSVPENELEMQKFFLPISRFSTFSCWQSVPTYIFKCFVVSISCLTTKEKTYHRRYSKNRQVQRTSPKSRNIFFKSQDFRLFRADTLSQVIFSNALLFQYLV